MEGVGIGCAEKSMDLRPTARLGSMVVTTKEMEEDYCVVMHRGKNQGTRLATLCPLVPVMSEDGEG